MLAKGLVTTLYDVAAHTDPGAVTRSPMKIFVV